MAIYIESENNVKSYHVNEKVEKAVIDLLESNEKTVWAEYGNCRVIIADRPELTMEEKK